MDVTCRRINVIVIRQGSAIFARSKLSEFLSNGLEIIGTLIAESRAVCFTQIADTFIALDAVGGIDSVPVLEWMGIDIRDSAPNNFVNKTGI